MEIGKVERGKFIVFEGLDGSGKTTQIKRLASHFTEQGLNCLVTSEPTNGPIGVLCRSALRGITPMSQDAMALIFAADRMEHILEEVRPALDAGVHVLCDRYVYSNMAFQGDIVPISTIAAYNERSMTKPDLSVFIDVKPEECSRRMTSSRQGAEIYDSPKLAIETRERYLKIFELYEKQMPIKIIDGNLSEDKVFVELLSALQDAL